MKNEPHEYCIQADRAMNYAIEAQEDEKRFLQLASESAERAKYHMMVAKDYATKAHNSVGLSIYERQKIANILKDIV